MSATPASLQEFAKFCRKLRGDEKSESQSFLDRFFQAFGHKGAIEAGAEFEARVKKGSKKGNMGYADLVWKPHLLIEMKKQGCMAIFDADIFLDRFFTIERVFAWEDKFRRLLLRFERISPLHYALKSLAYTMINLRHFCQG